MKSLKKCYILWLISICGWFAFHRFYLGKRKSAYLYFCTFGLFFIGSFYDLLFMKRIVERRNLKLLLKQTEKELKNTKDLKESLIKAHNYETASECRDKERLLISQIEEYKKAINGK